MPPKPKSIVERFWPKVNKSDGCWNWLGAKKSNGYGQINAIQKYMMAHRVSWILNNGPIPAGSNVLHKCDNRLCVNPDHLFLGTQRDNLLDALKKGRVTRYHPRYGEDNGISKLTVKKVHEMRRLNSLGMPFRELAKMFFVSKTAATNACKGVTWKHV